MDNTLTECNAEPSLWEALPEQDLTFEDYVLVDTDIAVWGALSDAEIVVLDHNNTEMKTSTTQTSPPTTNTRPNTSTSKKLTSTTNPTPHTSPDFNETTYTPSNFTEEINITTYEPSNFTGDFNLTTYEPSNFTGDFNLTTYEPSNFTGDFNFTTNEPSNFTGDILFTTNEPSNFTDEYNISTSKSTESQSTTTAIPDVCSKNPCQNGGTCVANGTEANCICAQPYAGKTCNESLWCIEGPGKTLCPERKCAFNFKTKVGRCECPKDQYFNYEKKQCETIDRCPFMPGKCTGQNEICKNGECQCAEHFRRNSEKKCVPNFCASNPCGENEVCEDLATDPGNVKCKCKKNFFFNGKFCQEGNICSVPSVLGCKQICNATTESCDCMPGFTLQPDKKSCNRWIPRGVSFQRPRHRLIAVASLGRLPRNRSIPVWFTRYPQTALSDRWRSLGITSLMNIGGIRYVHIHSYIGHHDQACVLACKMQCISKFHEIKLKS
ncbi:uncharacterized protein TNCV_4067591 [Trichonephila clavipes]|nr:uncharacterized protein TNCV_4067591 [Trichonephila clavipes]